MALLELDGVVAGYQGVTVVRDLSLTVEPGEVVALLGANGAGKSTTLLAISGLAELQGGAVRFDGGDLEGVAPHLRTRAGIGHVPEDRALFTRLTVAENLRLGGRGDDSGVAEVLDLFPALPPLLERRAGDLSGGEQQMLAMARALVGRPRLLLVDELSLGLAPIIVQRLLANVRRLADAGIGVLMVEQHVEAALSVADRVVVLARGRTTLTGTRAEVIDDRDRLTAAYLGDAEVGASG